MGRRERRFWHWLLLAIGAIVAAILVVGDVSRFIRTGGPSFYVGSPQALLMPLGALLVGLVVGVPLLVLWGQGRAWPVLWAWAVGNVVVTVLALMFVRKVLWLVAISRSAGETVVTEAAVHALWTKGLAFLAFAMALWCALIWFLRRRKGASKGEGP